MFDMGEGTGSIGGMHVQICEGAGVDRGLARSIYLTDEAFSFVEPALQRHVPSYSPYVRWGVTEVTADAWRSVANDMTALAARLDRGGLPEMSDVNWVTEVDLDNDIVTDAEALIRQFGDEPDKVAALQGLLIALANWLNESVERNDVLTIYGY